MEYLKSLDISYNSITEIPGSLGCYANLKILSLKPNPLSKHSLDLANLIDESIKFNKTNILKNSCPLFKKFLYQLRDAYDLEPKISANIIRSDLILNKEISYTYTPVKLNYFNFYNSESKRKNIISEILETERSYVAELQTVNDLFMIPLSSRMILNKVQFNTLFSNIRDIFRLHHDHFLPDLERVASLSEESLGNLFISFSESLSNYYQIYINNCDISASFLNWIISPAKQNNTIFQFPNYCEDKSKASAFNLEILENTWKNLNRFLLIRKKYIRHKQLNLGAYLILPVQRLPRYLLLIRSLLEATELNDPDYHYISLAFSKISSTITYLNESKREYEKQTSIVHNILSSINIDKQTLNMNLIFNRPLSNRMFLKMDGNFRLWKLAHSGSNTNQLIVKLFDSKACRINNNYMSYSFKNSRWSIFQDNFSQKITLILLTDILMICKGADLIAAVDINSKFATVDVSLNDGEKQDTMRLSDGTVVLYIKGISSDINEWKSLIEHSIP